MNWALLTAAAQTPAETAQNLNTQGNRPEESGNYPEAYSAVLERREKFAASPGPELADALQSLAEVREKARRFDDAARLNIRAQMIRGYR